MRRLAVLVALGLSLVVPAAAATQTEAARLAVTATSDHCAEGLPVVDYTVTNQWSAPVSVQTWWVADASVYGIAATHALGSAPDGAAGSFSLPFGFYATVTVYATASWPDGKVTTNASWAIPVADCAAAPTPTPTTSTIVEPPTTTTIATATATGTAMATATGTATRRNTARLGQGRVTL